MIALSGAAYRRRTQPRNLILFVPDSLRGSIVTPETTLNVLRSATRASASRIRIRCSDLHHGEQLGALDQSAISATPAPSPTRSSPATPRCRGYRVAIERRRARRRRPSFNGDYLNEETLLKMARGQGFQHRGDNESARPYLVTAPIAARTRS